jgi:hypothetical protein
VKSSGISRERPTPSSAVETGVTGDWTLMATKTESFLL